mgnify:FL=1
MNNNSERCAHIIYTPFTGVGLHGGFRGDEWFTHRINIFKRFTLKSLLNQSNRDFIHWTSFRPEERNHPYVRELAQYLADLNYPFVFTFNGLMYWDDKFNSYGIKEMARNFLMMLWDCWNYKDWKGLKNVLKYTWENKNNTLYRRVSESLSIMVDSLGKDYDWIYLTRIDSDDMFHKEAVNLIQSEPPSYKKALIFKEGYILNVQTGQVAEWNPPTNPPFHTIIFPGNIFFNPERYLEYYGDFKSHEDVARIFDCTVLDMKKYCISFHGKHISTAWDSPIIKKVYYYMILKNLWR